MRNRCKILKEVYKVDEAKKTVVCILTFDMQLNKADVTGFFPEAIIANKENITWGKAGIYTVVGISKCHPDDTFDVVKGKHIAQSKAKLQMYNKAANNWMYIYNNLNNLKLDINSRQAACRKASLDEVVHIKDLDK
jgi:hypothetical protein